MKNVFFKHSIKQVKKDAPWPLHMPWQGYLNPLTEQCEHCNYGITNEAVELHRHLEDLLQPTEQSGENHKKIIKAFCKEDSMTFTNMRVAMRTLSELVGLPAGWDLCKECYGAGFVIDKIDEAVRHEPPTGDHVQLWVEYKDTPVAMPVSPVFKEVGMLLKWIYENDSIWPIIVDQLVATLAPAERDAFRESLEVSVEEFGGVDVFY